MGKKKKKMEVREGVWWLNNIAILFLMFIGMLFGHKGASVSATMTLLFAVWLSYSNLRDYGDI